MSVKADMPLRTLRFRRSGDVLSPDDLERVHDTTLAVLDRVGVAIGSEWIANALGENGARVDGERVHFPPAMVEEALARATRSFTLAARDPRLDLPIDGEHGYLSLDGCCAEIVDLESGARRPSTQADLEQATRLADAMPEVSFVWPCVAVTDVPPATQALHQTRIQLVNTTKHIQAMSTFSAEDARGVIEMARIVAGGEEALRARPIVSSYQCSISPLTYEAGPIEAAVAFAEAGLPCGFVAMAIGTATAPTTPAGHLVVVNAEILAGITVLESLVPGAPTFYGPIAAYMDLHSGAMDLAWGPEEAKFVLASAQLARRYELPINMGAFGTGSKAPDWQSGAQSMLSSIANAMARADMVCGIGALYGARVFSLAQMLLDAEVFDITCALLEPWSATDEELALQVIEEVGPGGHFLAHPHTLEHMRERWTARFLGRETWEAWEATGRPGAEDRAKERARQILAEHEPLPLEDGIEKELLDIIERRDSSEGEHRE